MALAVPVRKARIANTILLMEARGQIKRDNRGIHQTGTHITLTVLGYDEH